jgi:dihydropteroate synthase
MSIGDSHVLLRPQRCVVFGVLNVTPDSFSDGGRYADVNAAVEHGVRMAAEGADYVDVGGESTRPGAVRVDATTETSRVLPVVRALARQGVRVSIDTSRSEVAAAALEAGAVLINDVSGGLGDPKMGALVAASGCPWVLMHSRGPSSTRPEYEDVVVDVCVELSARVTAAVEAGVDPDQLVLDPGLGFAKGPKQDWAILAQLDALLALGLPLLIGASRKSFLGTALAGADGTPRPVSERDAATVATSVLAAESGVWGVRVHAVRDTVDALAVYEAIATARRALGRNRRVGDRRSGAPGRRAADVDLREADGDQRVAITEEIDGDQHSAPEPGR